MPLGARECGVLQAATGAGDRPGSVVHHQLSGFEREVPSIVAVTRTTLKAVFVSTRRDGELPGRGPAAWRRRLAE